MEPSKADEGGSIRMVRSTISPTRAHHMKDSSKHCILAGARAAGLFLQDRTTSGSVCCNKLSKQATSIPMLEQIRNPSGRLA
jgi:hypothetical protein